MNEKLIATLSGQAMSSYTPRELELISIGVRIGAQNAKEINKRPEEWYAEREAKKPSEEEVDAVTEWLKRESGLGAAVENLKKMKTYEEVETLVLERYINALANNPKEAQQTIDLIKRLIEQYYVLHPQESDPQEDKVEEFSAERLIARKLYAENTHLQQSSDLRKTTKNALRLANVDTLADLVSHTRDELWVISRFGNRSLSEIEDYLSSCPGGFVFHWGMDLGKDSDIQQADMNVVRDMLAKSIRIEDIAGLKVATRCALVGCGIDTLHQLITRTKVDLLKLRGIGRAVVIDIENWLSQYTFGGFKFELKQ